MENNKEDTSLALEMHNIFRLANDPDTPISVLLELAHSNEELIRGAVAANPSTPDSMIKILSKDKSKHVLGCIKKRRNKK